MTTVQSDTDILNMALAHLGQTRKVGDLDTDRGPFASVGRQFFDTMRQQVNEEFPWNKSNTTATLAESAVTPPDEWLYAYGYPVNCKFFRRIVSDYRTDAADTRIPYRIARIDDTNVILTDEADARGEYSATLPGVNEDSGSLAIAQSFLLAFLIAPGVTGGDPFKLGDRAARSYAGIINAAKAKDAAEEQRDQPPDAIWQRARR